MKANDLNQSNFNVFIGIIRKAFLGLPFDYKNETFKLKATMVSPYDFLRKIEKPKSEYEKLLVELEKDFKVNARTEMYRRERGWIAQGVSQKAIKKLDVDGKTLLIPILSSPAVGIDTSVFSLKIHGICIEIVFFPNSFRFSSEKRKIKFNFCPLSNSMDISNANDISSPSFIASLAPISVVMIFSPVSGSDNDIS